MDENVQLRTLGNNYIDIIPNFIQCYHYRGTLLPKTKNQFGDTSETPSHQRLFYVPLSNSFNRFSDCSDVKTYCTCEEAVFSHIYIKAVPNASDGRFHQQTKRHFILSEWSTRTSFFNFGNIC